MCLQICVISFILLKGLYPVPSALVGKKGNFQSNELFGILMFFQREKPIVFIVCDFKNAWQKHATRKKSVPKQLLGMWCEWVELDLRNWTGWQAAAKGRDSQSQRLLKLLCEKLSFVKDPVWIIPPLILSKVLGPRKVWSQCSGAQWKRANRGRMTCEWGLLSWK